MATKDQPQAAALKKPVRTSRLDRKQVELAVAALLQYLAKTKAKELHLLNEDELIWLQLALKKIPQASNKPKRIPLPNSLYSSSTDVCLFSKEKGSKVKELLKEKGVTGVTQVVSIKKLKTHYKSFESRRNLLAMYDVFLCENKIFHILPRLLGKEFFRKKKFPISVNINKIDLREEISQALQCTLISVGQGSCSAVRIAHTGMSQEEIIVNIMGGVSEITKIIPRGWMNIQSINIKSTHSTALPIHTSLPDDVEVIDLGPVTKKRKIIEEKKAENRRKRRKPLARTAGMHDENDGNALEESD